MTMNIFLLINLTKVADLTINQIGHLVKLDLKYHLIKLVCGLVNKIIQFSQSGKCLNQ